MNMERSRVESRARYWLVHLDHEAPSEEWNSFAAWRASGDHAAAFEEVKQLWNALEGLSDRADFEKLRALTLAETEPAKRRRRLNLSSFGWPLPVAASVLLCVLAALGFVAGRSYVPTKTYVTDAAQRSTVQLEDGSQVVLGYSTRLDVQFSADRRQFRLGKGEAVFTVAEDPLRPFAVEAGDGEVTALGTRFQIRNEVRQVSVTLLEGRIVVDRDRMRDQGGSSVQLDPGEQVRFSVDVPGMSRRVVDPEVVSSWTTGRLKFKATPLHEALEEVNRYGRMRIRLLDDAFADTPINGMFVLGDSQSVVSALQLMLPLETVKRDGREIVLASVRRE